LLLLDELEEELERAFRQLAKQRLVEDLVWVEYLRRKPEKSGKALHGLE